jgi:tRNA U34 5-carboxymethylaminomethyl modifying GTPase MnmE/TrmE
MSDSADDPQETGPIRRAVREDLEQLEAIKELLGQAHREKAAGRIEELQAEIARRLREIREKIED